MKRVFFLLVSFALVRLAAQPDRSPVVKGLDETLAMLESEFVPLAEAIPADKYGFAPTGGEKVSRLSVANVAIWHTFDHYGQMVVYARMNGIIPPASRR